MVSRILLINLIFLVTQLTSNTILIILILKHFFQYKSFLLVLLIIFQNLIDASIWNLPIYNEDFFFITTCEGERFKLTIFWSEIVSQPIVLRLPIYSKILVSSGKYQFIADVLRVSLFVMNIVIRKFLQFSYLLLLFFFFWRWRSSFLTKRMNQYNLTNIFMIEDFLIEFKTFLIEFERF